MKKWLLPTVFITSQRLRTIIPMALWILSGVPLDTLLHDYGPSTLRTLVTVMHFSSRRDGKMSIKLQLHSHSKWVAPSQKKKKKSLSTPKCKRRLKRYLSQRAQCWARAASRRRWMALSARNEAHITLKNRTRLDGLGREQKQHVCLQQINSGKRIYKSVIFPLKFKNWGT